MNLAYPAAGGASVLYGGADFAGGIAARRGPVGAITILAGLAAIAITTAAVWWAPGAPTVADFAWATAAGLCSGAAAALIYLALAIGPVSIASPVLSVVSIALPVLVGLALGERPGGIALAGIVLAPVSIVLLARTGAPLADAERAAIRRVLGPSIAAGLVGGGFLVCVARLSPGAGLWPLVLARVIGIAALAVWVGLTRSPFAAPRPARGIAILAGVLDAAANLAYFYAVQRGSLALVATIIALSPATAVLLARGLLGERWSRMQQAGLVAALAAAACIAAG